MSHLFTLFKSNAAPVNAHAAKVFIAILSIAALMVPDFLSESLKISLEFNRLELANGEYWRLWTGHFVHFTTAHMTMNLGALILTGYLCFWHGKVFPFTYGIPAITGPGIFRRLLHHIRTH